MRPTPQCFSRHAERHRSRHALSATTADPPEHLSGLVQDDDRAAVSMKVLAGSDSGRHWRLQSFNRESHPRSTQEVANILAGQQETIAGDTVRAHRGSSLGRAATVASRRGPVPPLLETLGYLSGASNSTVTPREFDDSCNSSVPPAGVPLGTSKVNSTGTVAPGATMVSNMSVHSMAAGSGA